MYGTLVHLFLIFPYVSTFALASVSSSIGYFQYSSTFYIPNLDNHISPDTVIRFYCHRISTFLFTFVPTHLVPVTLLITSTNPGRTDCVYFSIARPSECHPQPTTRTTNPPRSTTDAPPRSQSPDRFKNNSKSPIIFITIMLIAIPFVIALLFSVDLRSQAVTPPLSLVTDCVVAPVSAGTIGTSGHNVLSPSTIPAPMTVTQSLSTTGIPTTFLM